MDNLRSTPKKRKIVAPQEDKQDIPSSSQVTDPSTFSEVLQKLNINETRKLQKELLQYEKKYNLSLIEYQTKSLKEYNNNPSASNSKKLEEIYFAIEKKNTAIELVQKKINLFEQQRNDVMKRSPLPPVYEEEEEEEEEAPDSVSKSQP